MSRIHELANGAVDALKNPLAILTAAALGAGALTAAGCGQEDNAVSPHDKTRECLKSGINGQELVHVLPVPGENFSIKATYSTDYDTASWKITDTKTLDIKEELVPAPDAKAPEVLVEHLHVDASVKAKKSGVNGLQQDSMDDHLHTGTQAGFLITPDYPYTEKFVIQGYSENLTSGWGFMVGGYGSLDIEEKRLTEGNLRDQGAIGTEIQMVTDLLMKNDKDAAYHKTVIGDDFIVPLKGYGCTNQPK